MAAAAPNELVTEAVDQHDHGAPGGTHGHGIDAAE